MSHVVNRVDFRFFLGPPIEWTHSSLWSQLPNRRGSAFSLGPPQPSGRLSSLCWIGAVRLLLASGDAVAFNRAKGFAVAGLTLGFLVWQVGFMSIGGEWFGMWMSPKWNGVPDAFRFFVTILMVLIYLVLPDRADDP